MLFRSGRGDGWWQLWLSLHHHHRFRTCAWQRAEALAHSSSQWGRKGKGVWTVDGGKERDTAWDTPPGYCHRVPQSATWTDALPTQWRRLNRIRFRQCRCGFSANFSGYTMRNSGDCRQQLCGGSVPSSRTWIIVRGGHGHTVEKKKVEEAWALHKVGERERGSTKGWRRWWCFRVKPWKSHQLWVRLSSQWSTLSSLWCVVMSPKKGDTFSVVPHTPTHPLTRLNILTRKSSTVQHTARTQISSDKRKARFAFPYMLPDGDKLVGAMPRPVILQVYRVRQVETFGWESLQQLPVCANAHLSSGQASAGPGGTHRKRVLGNGCGAAGGLPSAWPPSVTLAWHAGTWANGHRNAWDIKHRSLLCNAVLILLLAFSSGRRASFLLRGVGELFLWLFRSQYLGGDTTRFLGRRMLLTKLRNRRRGSGHFLVCFLLSDRHGLDVDHFWTYWICSRVVDTFWLGDQASLRKPWEVHRGWMRAVWTSCRIGANPQRGLLVCRNSTRHRLQHLPCLFWLITEVPIPCPQPSPSIHATEGLKSWRTPGSVHQRFLLLMLPQYVPKDCETTSGDVTPTSFKDKLLREDKHLKPEKRPNAFISMITAMDPTNKCPDEQDID